MNKNGQVLVCFVILLPILIMIMALVIDLGFMMVKTYKAKDTVRIAIKYGLENNDIEGVKTILDKNINDKYEINTNGNIEITINGSYKAILGRIFNKEIYNYEFKYIGYIDNDEIYIKEG